MSKMAGQVAPPEVADNASVKRKLGKVKKTAPKKSKHKRDLSKTRKLTKEKKHERNQLIVGLMANRYSYNEIAKVLSSKYTISLKAAYHYLSRFAADAIDNMESICTDEHIMREFQLIVASITDTIRRAKNPSPTRGKNGEVIPGNPDFSAALKGEALLMKLYGFDKGLTLEAIQSKRATAGDSGRKHVEAEQKNLTLLEHMRELSNEQIQAQLHPELDAARKQRKEAKAEINKAVNEDE